MSEITVPDKNEVTLTGQIVEVDKLRYTNDRCPVINFKIETLTVDPFSGRNIRAFHYCSLFGEEAFSFDERERDYEKVTVKGQLRNVDFPKRGGKVDRYEILVAEYRLESRIEKTRVDRETPPSRREHDDEPDA